RVIKSDGTREPFNEQKLRAGMLRALEKRPVSVEDLEAAISRLCHRLRATGEREVPARQVGGFVMEALQQLDDVAYVRFASVYRSFQDISEFAAEVDRLRGRAGGGEPQDDDTPQQ
ncbi:MAG: transcriptional regulator NrdR, partial [Alloalcanivorax venustensis]